MSKLVFPSAGVPLKAYRGFISEARTWFQRIASHAEKSPKSKPEWLTQIAPLITELGGVVGTGAMVSQNQTVSVVSPIGTDPHNAFVNLTGNTVSNIQFSTSVAMTDQADVIPVTDNVGGDSHNGVAQVTGTGALTVRLPTNTVILDNSDAIAIKNSAATVTVSGGTVSVAGTVLQSANLPATAALVQNADAAVPLGDATAVANGQSVGTAAVSAGVITRITTPTGVKIAKTGVAYPCPAPTGTYASQITLTINAAGAITGVLLS